MNWREEWQLKSFNKYKSKLFLTSQQVEVLKDLIATHSERPTFEEYEKWEKRMKKVDPKQKPKRKMIGHSSLGYGRDQIRLDDDFNAEVDLPPGWGVYSMADSGSNYTIHSAGQLLLTDLWNSWYNPNCHPWTLIKSFNEENANASLS